MGGLSGGSTRESPFRTGKEKGWNRRQGMGPKWRWRFHPTSLFRMGDWHGAPWWFHAVTATVGSMARGLLHCPSSGSPRGGGPMPCAHDIPSSPSTYPYMNHRPCTTSSSHRRCNPCRHGRGPSRPLPSHQIHPGSAPVAPDVHVHLGMVP